MQISIRTKQPVSILRRGANLGYSVHTAVNRAAKTPTKQAGVHFTNKVETRQIQVDAPIPMILYDS